jgi:serine/threonine protein phosphatase PrpC
VAEFFRKLFGSKPKNPPVTDGATTAPLSVHHIQSIMYNQTPRYETQQLVAATGQSVGKQREHNEDSLLAITSTISGTTSIPFGLYIVADGMGGHQFGEVASNAAIRIMAGHILRAFHSYLFNLPTQPMQEPLQEIMETAIKEAHRFVQREAPGSGTTVTAALVMGQQVTVAHVGDSRAYAVYPDGRIIPVT